MTLGSGRPFSSFGPGVDSYPPTPVVQIGIRRPRPVLAELIERRVLGMIDDGLVEEVRTISAGCGFSRTAAQALGYKEILSHLAARSARMRRSNSSSPARGSLLSARSDGSVGIPRVRWIDVEHDPVADAVPAVIDAITEQRSR